MSERELRQGIACHLCPEEAECGLCNKARKALSEPPDVVVLLRWVEERTEAHIREREKLPIGAEGYDSFNATRIAFDSMRKKIEQQFHVRLTDDGWEWVEEGE